MRTVDEASRDENFARVKAVVSCLDVAQHETELRLVGGVYRGKCPIHGGENPTSFCIIPDGDGFYKAFACHSCGASGDVFDLAAGVYDGCHRPVWAMEELVRRFGVPLSRPEELMTETQLRARKVGERARRMFDEGIIWHLFKLHVVPLAEEIEDPMERKALLDECMKAAGLKR